MEWCLTLNPATLMPLPCEDYETEGEHDSLEVTELCTKPRPDIRDVPLIEPDWILFVDGSDIPVVPNINAGVESMDREGEGFMSPAIASSTRENTDGKQEAD